MRRTANALGFALFTLLVTLFISEFLLRAVHGVALLEFHDYRLKNAIVPGVPRSASEYDETLGWRLKPHFVSGKFTTIDRGVRSNGIGETTIRQGGILAVGASFTVGSEVADTETWSAHLEQLTGRPVINAGINGYGFDQIVLRAEELIPIVKPEIIVVDLVSENIPAAGHSYRGRPKPYFATRDGKLELKNHPVPRDRTERSSYDLLKSLLGYSYLADRVMASFFRDFWLGSLTMKIMRADNDPVDVACLLLHRLKSQADAEHIRLLVYGQYGGGFATTYAARSHDMALVEECAGELGIPVIDELAYLRSLLARDPAELKLRYVMRPDAVAYGHKSSLGNLDVATLIASGLAASPPSGPHLR